jgi:signal transduction histidine kinase
VSLTVFNTAHHDGPFVRASITQSLLATQLFAAVTAVTSPILGAVIEERHAAERSLHENERRLRSSRARIVQAGHAERRRFEHNLHDGAQQRLVALAVTLRLAIRQLDKDPAGAADRLAEADDELRSRSRSYGSWPTVSIPRCLPTAASSQRSRASRPTRTRRSN